MEQWQQTKKSSYKMLWEKCGGITLRGAEGGGESYDLLLLLFRECSARKQDFKCRLLHLAPRGGGGKHLKKGGSRLLL